MTAATETAEKPKGTRSQRRAKTRKEGGQAKVQDLSVLRDRVDELLTLKRKMDSAATEFSDAIRATAEKAGLHAKNVRSYVVARAGEKFKERKEEVGQLGLIFEEVHIINATH